MNYCEENLLKNTKLDPSLDTAGKSNKYWIFLSNYGLAIICFLRNDQLIAVKHLMRIYLLDERTARTVWLPKLYKTFFKPKCQDIFDWYKHHPHRVLWRNQFKFTPGDTGKIITGLALTIGGTVLFLSGNPIGAPIALKGAESFDKMNVQVAEENQKLALELESKLDNRCREIATEILQNC